jgi:2-amino-4-hydroxy-6-hydroxymethyldihydropteridine diphosphokinase
MKNTSAKPPALVYLALGSNLGDRLANLRSAVAALPPAVSLLDQSPVYETSPWGLTDQPSFLNMVLKGETALPPVDLLDHLKLLEIRLGRQPAVRWGPRSIDMDILFYADRVLNSRGLTLPHPHLQERAFVLVPLADLEPDLVHPVFGRSVRQLLAAVDANGVKPYEPSD